METVHNNTIFMHDEQFAVKNKSVYLELEAIYI